MPWPLRRVGLAGRLPAFAGLCLLAASPAAAQIQALSPGAPVERSIAAGERHRYQLSIARGSAIKLTVDQLGADVVATLRGPSGEPATAHDEGKRRFGRELLVWLAPVAGDAQITIEGKATTAGQGRYRATVAVLGPSDTLPGAVAALASAALLPHDARTDAAPSSVAAWAAALEAWRTLGDRDAIALCLFQLGRLHARQQRPGDAIGPLTEALAIYETLGSPQEVVGTLLQLGNAHVLAGQSTQALAAYERAHQVPGDIDPINRAIVDDDLARICLDIGELERAVALGERAAAAFRAAGARRDEHVALERLATTFVRMRRLDDALRCVTEAITLARVHGRDNDLATLHVTLGRVHLAAGDDDAALAAYRASLGLFKGRPPSFLGALLSIGRMYGRQRDWPRATDLLELTLSQVPPQMKQYWAAVASELGYALTRQGHAARAIGLQRKALDIVRASGSRFAEFVVLKDLASTERALGDLAGATATVARLAELAPGLPGRPSDDMVLREQARNARMAGDLPLARRYLDRALDLIDSARGRVRSHALRTTFGTQADTYYSDAIDLAMAMQTAEPLGGHAERGLELFERSRARSLTELLAEANIDIRTGVPLALVEEERALRRRLGLADMALRESGSAAARSRAPALEQEIDDLTRRLAVLDGRIRSESRRYAELTRPSPISAADLQRLLDAETVLIAYSLGAEGSWGWAVTRESVTGFPLPPLSKVDDAVRRVIALVTTRQRRQSGAASARTEDAHLEREAAAMSDLVLGPVAARLAGGWRGRRLAIVASGPLEYLPFAALPVPAWAGSSTNPRALLVDHHEIVQLPSASVLALLRAESTSRSRAARGVVVVADPVYGADDPRLRARAAPPRVLRAAARGTSVAAGPAPDRATSLRRGVETGTGSGFARLVFSREEAHSVARLAAREGALEALDFRASVATMGGRAVRDARIVHVAAHGILNSARPELSGLVLSLVDERGRPQDGVLRLNDVLNLTLSAELVVLSGCETALGKQLAGEGLVGLARAFMYAGAPRVLASLWQVDDLATAELMRRFYHALLVTRQSPAAALRAAQREMRATGRWASPYYWAGFTLLGDWR